MENSLAQLERHLGVTEERLTHALTAASNAEWFLRHDPNTPETRRWAKRRRNSLKARWEDYQKAQQAFSDERARRARP